MSRLILKSITLLTGIACMIIGYHQGYFLYLVGSALIGVYVAMAEEW